MRAIEDQRAGLLVEGVHQRLQFAHQLIEGLHRLTQVLIGLRLGIIGLQGLLQLLEAQALAALEVWAVKQNWYK